MCGWNHRVVKHTHEDEEAYHVHEAYYDDSGNATSITANPVAPMGGTVDELRAELELFKAALDKPVLSYEDF